MTVLAYLWKLQWDLLNLLVVSPSANLEVLEVLDAKQNSERSNLELWVASTLLELRSSRDRLPWEGNRGRLLNNRNRDRLLNNRNRGRSPQRVGGDGEIFTEKNSRDKSDRLSYLRYFWVLVRDCIAIGTLFSLPYCIIDKPNLIRLLSHFKVP